jgi:hypothetical protein
MAFSPILRTNQSAPIRLNTEASEKHEKPYTICSPLSQASSNPLCLPTLKEFQKLVKLIAEDATRILNPQSIRNALHDLKNTWTISDEYTSQKPYLQAGSLPKEPINRKSTIQSADTLPWVQQFPEE